MNLNVAFALIGYWTIIILLFTINDDLSGNLFVNNGYSTNAELNSSGFSSDEIDTGTGGIWSFFSGVASVFVAIGRFIGLVFFGITPALSGLPQYLLSAWQSALTLFTIGFIIDSLWSG